MPKQSRPDDQKPGTLGMPNQASETEQAEGSRENVNVDSGSSDRDDAGGITNRPLGRDHEEQDQLPPRGTAKDGSHA
jgi:hypothetical protein